MSEPIPITIRPIEARDEAQWRELWAAYLAFYSTTVGAKVYQSTFARIIGDAPYDPSGFVAQAGEDLVGLVHYLPHRHCWKEENVVYLQDLYVTKAARNQGLGQALIEAVYAQADHDGCPTVYWLTQDFNVTARSLYDQVAQLTPFVKYQR